MNTINFWLNNYTTILAWLGSAGAITVALQFLKRKFNIDGKKTLHSLVGLLSLVPVLVDYVVNYGQQMPGVLPKNFAYVFTLAVTLHRFFVGPLYNRIEQFFAVTYADAQKWEQSQAQQVSQDTAATGQLYDPSQVVGDK